MAKKIIKPRKEVKLPKGSQGYYYKNDTFLKLADTFVYEMIVHEIMPNGACMVDNKKTKVKEFKGYQTVKVVDKAGRKFVQSVDLVCAPEDFLNRQNFKFIE